MVRRRKRRKGGTRASTSRSRSSGRPAQTAASNGTSAWWWWRRRRSEAAGAAAAEEEEKEEEEALPLGKAGGAAVSSPSPRDLVLRIVLGGRDGLVGCAGADASIAGDTGPRDQGSGFWGKSGGFRKRQQPAPEP
jgi:hypothetical protein